MNNRNTIRQCLELQQSIEGNTPELELLFKVLDYVKYNHEWNDYTVTRMKHYPYSYGHVSRESDVFYYPSNRLLGLQKLFIGE